MGKSKAKMTILVTGGGGFLGKNLINKLVQCGYSVKNYSRNRYPDLEAMGVTSIQGDLQDSSQVISACKGCDTVFHVGAKVGLHGDYQDFFNTNVIGTRNVIDACRSCGVGRLIYTSSPSVTFDGGDQEGIDESAPYPDRYLSFYPATKAIAEQEVFKANSRNLSVVTLRPHLIWGPGDPHFFPKITEAAASNKLRIIGDGRNLVDTVYIDNAVQAHINAMERLSPDNPIAGKAYFVTNQEPWPIKDIINQILAVGGLPPLQKHLSAPVAYLLGFAMEKVCQWLRLKQEPRLTRMIVSQFTKAHWYDPAKPRAELGYTPEISMKEGFERYRKSMEDSD